MKDLADVKWTCPVCGKENTFHVHAHDVRLIPQTNADRIRAMTDEELAKFLLWVEWNTVKPYWSNWLKQEIDDDNA